MSTAAGFSSPLLSFSSLAVLLFVAAAAMMTTTTQLASAEPTQLTCIQIASPITGDYPYGVEIPASCPTTNYVIRDLNTSFINFTGTINDANWELEFGGNINITINGTAFNNPGILFSENITQAKKLNFSGITLKVRTPPTTPVTYLVALTGEALQNIGTLVVSNCVGDFSFTSTVSVKVAILGAPNALLRNVKLHFTNNQLLLDSVTSPVDAVAFMLTTPQGVGDNTQILITGNTLSVTNQLTGRNVYAAWWQSGAVYGIHSALVDGNTFYADRLFSTTASQNVRAAGVYINQAGVQSILKFVTNGFSVTNNNVYANLRSDAGPAYFDLLEVLSNLEWINLLNISGNTVSANVTSRGTGTQAWSRATLFHTGSMANRIDKFHCNNNHATSLISQAGPTSVALSRSAAAMAIDDDNDDGGGGGRGGGGLLAAPDDDDVVRGGGGEGGDEKEADESTTSSRRRADAQAASNYAHIAFVHCDRGFSHAQEIRVDDNIVDAASIYSDQVIWSTFAMLLSHVGSAVNNNTLISVSRNRFKGQIKIHNVNSGLSTLALAYLQSAPDLGATGWYLVDDNNMVDLWVVSDRGPARVSIAVVAGKLANADVVSCSRNVLSKLYVSGGANAGAGNSYGAFILFWVQSSFTGSKTSINVDDNVVPDFKVYSDGGAAPTKTMVSLFGMQFLYESNLVSISRNRISGSVLRGVGADGGFPAELILCNFRGDVKQTKYAAATFSACDNRVTDTQVDGAGKGSAYFRVLGLGGTAGGMVFNFSGNLITNLRMNAGSELAEFSIAHYLTGCTVTVGTPLVAVNDNIMTNISIASGKQIDFLVAALECGTNKHLVDAIDVIGNKVIGNAGEQSISASKTTVIASFDSSRLHCPTILNPTSVRFLMTQDVTTNIGVDNFYGVYRVHDNVFSSFVTAGWHFYFYFWEQNNQELRGMNSISIRGNVITDSIVYGGFLRSKSDILFKAAYLATKLVNVSNNFDVSNNVFSNTRVNMTVQCSFVHNWLEIFAASSGESPEFAVYNNRARSIRVDGASSNTINFFGMFWREPPKNMVTLNASMNSYDDCTIEAWSATTTPGTFIGISNFKSIQGLTNFYVHNNSIHNCSSTSSAMSALFFVVTEQPSSGIGLLELKGNTVSHSTSTAAGVLNSVMIAAVYSGLSSSNIVMMDNTIGPEVHIVSHGVNAGIIGQASIFIAYNFFGSFVDNSVYIKDSTVEVSFDQPYKTNLVTDCGSSMASIFQNSAPSGWSSGVAAANKDLVIEDSTVTATNVGRASLIYSSSAVDAPGPTALSWNIIARRSTVKAVRTKPVATSAVGVFLVNASSNIKLLIDGVAASVDSTAPSSVCASAPCPTAVTSFAVDFPQDAPEMDIKTSMAASVIPVGSPIGSPVYSALASLNRNSPDKTVCDTVGHSGVPAWTPPYKPVKVVLNASSVMSEGASTANISLFYIHNNTHAFASGSDVTIQACFLSDSSYTDDSMFQASPELGLPTASPVVDATGTTFTFTCNKWDAARQSRFKGQISGTAASVVENACMSPSRTETFTRNATESRDRGQSMTKTKSHTIPLVVRTRTMSNTTYNASAPPTTSTTTTTTTGAPNSTSTVANTTSTSAAAASTSTSTTSGLASSSTTSSNSTTAAPTTTTTMAPTTTATTAASTTTTTTTTTTAAPVVIISNNSAATGTTVTSEETVTATYGIAGGVAVVGLLGGEAAAPLTASRALAVLSLSACSMDDIEQPFPIAAFPGWEIGPDRGRYYRASVISGMIASVVIYTVILAIGFCVICVKPNAGGDSPNKFEAACTAVYLPSSGFIWAGLFVDGILASGTTLVYVSETREMDIPIALVGYLFVFVPFAIIAKKVFYIVFAGQLLRYSPTHIRSTMKAIPKCLSSVLTGPIGRFTFFGHNLWFAASQMSAEIPRQCRQMRMMYWSCRAKRPNESALGNCAPTFILIEFVLTAFVAIARGLRIDCEPILWIVCVLSILVAILQLYLRPYTVPLKNILGCTQSLCTAIACCIVAVSESSGSNNARGYGERLAIASAFIGLWSAPIMVGRFILRNMCGIAVDNHDKETKMSEEMLLDAITDAQNGEQQKVDETGLDFMDDAKKKNSTAAMSPTSSSSGVDPTLRTVSSVRVPPATTTPAAPAAIVSGGGADLNRAVGDSDDDFLGMAPATATPSSPPPPRPAVVVDDFDDDDL